VQSARTYTLQFTFCTYTNLIPVTSSCLEAE